MFIDNWRWAGVPFFLRTGKRLPKRASEIAIQFKDVPPILFNANPEQRLEPNVLSIRIQPDEGFALGIASKLPGPRVQIYPVKMDFHYGSTFGVVVARSVRAAAARRDGRRRDAVHAPRRGRGSLAMGDCRCSTAGRSKAAMRCRRTRPDRGDRPKLIG